MLNLFFDRLREIGQVILRVISKTEGLPSPPDLPMLLGAKSEEEEIDQ